jgi:7-cyano-7-deazaguanine synthase in queuosine biosynthesis
MKAKNYRTRPLLELFIAEKEVSSPRRGQVCRDGIDIEYRPDVLLKFFLKRPNPETLDLLRVIASVAHADRRLTRRHSVCWGRDFILDIPVSDPDFWSALKPSFCSVLECLSGDSWDFSFRKLTIPIELPNEGYLDFPPDGELATAYSDGLDSFTVARLVASGEIALSDGDRHKRNIALITTGRTLHLGDISNQFGYRARQISVPFKVKRVGKDFYLREISYRTRALVFQTIAALASVQSGSNMVIVGEAGQGSLGPWLTVTGEETPDLRTHPFFTRRLGEFLATALRADVITFDHPLIWSTKGEGLHRLVEAGLHKGWEDTHSCAVQVRHQETRGKRLHCGLCPNCLLRRQSLLAANLDDPDSNYDYGSANAEIGSLVQKKVAQGLMPLVDLAHVNESPLLSRVLERQIDVLADAIQLDRSETAKRLSRLIRCHEGELRHFISLCPSRSLLRRFGEALL